jgi:hypothetical protein
MLKRFFFFFFFLYFLGFLYTQNTEELESIKISSALPNPYCTNYWDRGWESKYILQKNTPLFDEASDMLGFINYKNPIFLPELGIVLGSIDIDNWKISQSDNTNLRVYATSFPNELKSFNSAYESAKNAKSYIYLSLEHSGSSMAKYLVDIAYSFARYSIVGLDSFVYLAEITDFKTPFKKEVDDLVFDVASKLLEVNLFYNIALFNYFASDYSDEYKTTYFTYYWKKAMNYTAESLKKCADASNSLAQKAELAALKLYENGVYLPEYKGAAKAPYLEWKSFASSYKDFIVKGVINDSSMGAKYAKLYYFSSLIYDICARPSQVPVFIPYNSPRIIYNELCSIDENYPNLNNLSFSNQKNYTILSYLIYFNKVLNESLVSLENEQKLSEQKALGLKQNASSFKKYIDSQKPDKFVDEDFFVAEVKTIKVANVSGNLSELIYLSSHLINLADWYYSQADKEKRKVFSILLFENASDNYLKTIEVLEQINNTITQKTSIACDAAKSQINELNTLLTKANNQKDKNYSYIDILNSAYINASSKFDKAQEQSNLFAKYSYCKEAYLAALSYKSSKNTQTAQVLLKKFLEYIQAGEKMGADVSSYRENYNAFNSLIKSGYNIDLEDIQSNIKSIQSYLNTFMNKETELYETISYTLEQIKEIDSNLYLQFHSNMAKYLDNGYWNLNAFKNKATVNSYLVSFFEKLNKNIKAYVQKAICTKAKFYPNTYSSIYIDKSFDIGGTWESENPLNLIITDLEVSCPLEIVFSNKAIKNKSDNIDLILVNPNSFKLNIQKLGAYEKIFFSFSEEKIPFSISKHTCLLSIDNNYLKLSSNYTVNALYLTSSAILSIPWDRVLDDINAKAFYNSNIYNGNLKLNSLSSLPAVEFSIPLSKGQNAIRVQIDSKLKRSFNISNEKLELTSKQTYIYSYQINLENVGSCSNIYFTKDEKIPNIVDLNVYSPTANIKVNKKYLKSSFWSADIKALENTSKMVLNVQIEFSDVDSWFNQTYSRLYQKAQELNDSKSLEDLKKAKIYFANKDYTQASKTLSSIEKRLLEIETNFEAFEVLKQKIEYTKELANKLNASSSSLNYSSKSKLLSLAKDLLDAILKAEKLSTTDPTKAAFDLEVAINKVNSALEKEAIKKFSDLEKKAISFLESQKTNPSNDTISLADNIIKIKELLAQNSFLEAYLLIEESSSALNLLESNFKEGLINEFEKLKKEKLDLESKIGQLLENLGTYAQSIKVLESAKTSYKPLLGSKDVGPLEKKLSSSFKNWSESFISNSSSPQKMLQTIEKNKQVLGLASANYNFSYSKYLESKSSLAQRATSLLDKAKITSNSLEGKSKAMIDEAINKAQDFIAKEDYANAIVLLEKALKPTLSSETIEQESSNNLPIFEVFVSIVFVIAIVYLLLKGKAKQTDEKPKEPKVLKKLQ